MNLPDLTWITWTPSDMEAAADRAIADKQARLEALKAIPAAERTFANTVEALSDAEDMASDVVQQLDLLADVHVERSFRDAARATLERLEPALLALDFDRDLWRAFTEWKARNETLQSSDAKLATDLERVLMRRGFALDDTQFAELQDVSGKLQNLESQFSAAINEWDAHTIATADELRGVPERVITGMHKNDDGTYRVTLAYADSVPVMQYAESSELRERLAKLVEQEGGMANAERLARMITLRQRIAQLLGYATFADYACEPRMAASAANVTTFLRGVMEKLTPLARAELRSLIEYKKKALGLDQFKPIHYYELAYWKQRMAQELFKFDPEELKQYFPLPRVMAGAMELFGKLLGVTFQKLDCALWHADVESYAVINAATQESMGILAFDLHPRQGKYGHAAITPALLPRRVMRGLTQGMVAILCNFSRPTDACPSLLSHDDVETLFHEMGHALHTFLSGGNRHFQNGLYVALDFAEAVSQLMENWAWNPTSLARVSGHWSTGAAIPENLLTNMLARRTYMMGGWYLQQSVRSAYDLHIHSQPLDNQTDAIQLTQLWRDMQLQLMAIDLPDDTAFPAGWGHLTDYAAGYYSYLWSQVYALDIFSRFGTNPLDTAVSAELRTKIFEPGASLPESDLMKAFLGREPSSDAFFKLIIPQ